MNAPLYPMHTNLVRNYEGALRAGGEAVNYDATYNMMNITLPCTVDKLPLYKRAAAMVLPVQDFNYRGDTAQLTVSFFSSQDVWDRSGGKDAYLAHFRRAVRMLSELQKIDPNVLQEYLPGDGEKNANKLLLRKDKYGYHLGINFATEHNQKLYEGVCKLFENFGNSDFEEYKHDTRKLTFYPEAIMAYFARCTNRAEAALRLSETDPKEFPVLIPLLLGGEKSTATRSAMQLMNAMRTVETLAEKETPEAHVILPDKDGKMRIAFDMPGLARGMQKESPEYKALLEEGLKPVNVLGKKLKALIGIKPDWQATPDKKGLELVVDKVMLAKLAEAQEQRPEPERTRTYIAAPPTIANPHFITNVTASSACDIAASVA